MAIFERVQRVTAETLVKELTAVKPESNFTSDLGADSLDRVELIIALENEFSSPDKKLEISDEEAETLQTVQDVVNYLKEKVVDA